MFRYFVVSGFIVANYFIQIEKLTFKDIIEFYKLKIGQIFPIYYIIIFITIYISKVILLNRDFNVLRTDFFNVLIFFNNLVNVINRTEYLQQVVELTVNLQFF